MGENMMKEKKNLGLMHASERDGVEYRKAPVWSLFMGMAFEGIGAVCYLMIGFATMEGTLGYGMATLTVGGILTVLRIWDGFNDFLVAVVFEKINPKFGKIKLFMIGGWIACAIGLLLLYCIAAGKFDGALGIVVFVASYALYEIGNTFRAVGAGPTAVVVTNDPTQRPMTTIIGTIYSYGIPIICTNLITFVILPKYNNKYNLPMLSETCLWFIGLSFILLVISLIGVWKVDRPETFEKIVLNEKQKDKQKVTVKEMLAVLKDNRNMQMHILTGVSDKLAQQTASQSIIATLMNGVLIGSYVASTMVSNVGNIVGFAFLFMGGIFIAKWGAKKATVVWSWISILIAVGTVAFCFLLGGPDGMKKLGEMGIPLVIYAVLTLLRNASMMGLTATNGARAADVTDYEYMRSGNYMPAIVSSTYSIIDKIVSSFGTLMATGCIALVGYVNTVPQLGDKATWPIFWMAMFLNFGMQIVGWIVNLIAMKFYTLDREEMIVVQKTLNERKMMKTE